MPIAAPNSDAVDECVVLTARPKSEEQSIAKAEERLEQSPLKKSSSTIFVPVFFIILLPDRAVPIEIIRPQIIADNMGI